MAFIQLLLNGLVSGLVVAVLALGFTLIHSGIRIFNVAYGATYAVGGYALYALTIHAGLPLAAAGIAAVTLAALLGVGTEKAVFWPLQAQRGAAAVALIASLGLFTVITNGIALAFGNETLFVRQGPDETFQIAAGLILTRGQLAQAVLSIVALAGAWRLLNGSGLGRRIRALRDHPELSQVIGIDLQRVRTTVFALGSALGGAAAVMAALDVGIDPSMGMPALLAAAVASVIGGSHRFEGAIAGGLLVGMVRSLVIWFASALWVDAVMFTLLVAFLLTRPDGLLAPSRRAEERA